MRKTHPLAWQAPEAEFAMTYCRRCTAGWTRERERQEEIIVCLLNQELTLTNITGCNRFEPREEDTEMSPRMPTRPEG
jgi:hypothetical protein